MLRPKRYSRWDVLAAMLAPRGNKNAGSRRAGSRRSPGSRTATIGMAVAGLLLAGGTAYLWVRHGSDVAILPCYAALGAWLLLTFFAGPLVVRPEWVRLQRDRTRIVRRAQRAGDPGSIAGALSDVRERRRSAQRRLNNLDVIEWMSILRLDPRATTLWVIGYMVLMSSGQASRLASNAGLVQTAMFLAGSCTAIAGFWWAGSSVRRARRNLDASRCLDCGYGLSGVVPALPPTPTGETVGPERCPECGAPWPLVPPELPIFDSSRW